MSSAEGPNGAGGRTAVVLTHSKPEETAIALRSCLQLAEQEGFQLVTTEEEMAKHDGIVEGLAAVAELPDSPDLCLALGGDGTILRALRRYSGTNVPVFGVNYGTIGFLAAAEAAGFEHGLERAFAGDFEVVELPALIASPAGEEQLALNDISFTRRPHHRVAELSYRLGGREVGHVRCDGLVAATPAGSTGYNLANGGPILAWGVEGYVVSFIAPHTLTARALVVAPDDVLHVHNVAERDSVEVAFDGVHAAQLDPGAELEISFRDSAACLAQLEGETFYRRIREKFGRLAH